VPFDTERLEIKGTPVPVLDGLLTSSAFGWAAFAATAEGVLAHVQGAEPTGVDQLAWLDRAGRLAAIGDRRYFLGVRLSPTGDRAAVRVSGANDTLWIQEFRRGGGFSRLTFRGNVTGAIWTPNGQRIIYNIGNEIASIAADGSGDDRTLLQDAFTGVPTTVTPDGKTVLYDTNRPGTGWDVWALSVEDKKASPVLAASYAERFARLSPDGRWMAYTSNETGQEEVYVQSFPALGKKFKVSPAGGSLPVWSPAGTELYFRRGPQLFAVPIRVTSQSFDYDPPLERPVIGDLPETRVGLDSFDAARDGRLFVIQTSPPPLPTAFHLVTGWLDEVRSRVAPAR